MFLENKYTRWYLAIINKAKHQNRKKNNGVYYESHHIIPRSMGGTEEVLLTAKEHFICHLLLCRMLTGSDKHKMINALIKMSFSKSKGQERYTANTYTLVRKLIAEKNTEMFKDKPKSEQTRQNMKGRSGVWKRTEIHRKQASDRQKGNPVSWTCLDDDDPKKIEIRQKISTAKKILENNPTETILMGRTKMAKAMLSKRWFTNGKDDIFSETCPDGYVSGRTKNRKVKPNAS